MYPMDEGYDTELMQDNFRSMIILKSNLSQSNIEIPMYFDGGISLMRELPSLNKMNAKEYDKIRRLQEL